MSKNRTTAALLAGLFVFAFMTPSLRAGTLFQSLGTAGPLNWSVLTLINTGTVSINGVINGNIGIADNSGDLLLADSPTVVNGNVYLQAGASIVNAQQVNGVVYSGQNLAQVNQDALNASAIFAHLAPTVFLPGNAVNGNASITARSSLTVLDLTSVNLGAGQNFTIHGSASSQVVINVSGGLTLNNASIQLAGGITANDVVFNFTGAGLQLTANGRSAIDALVIAPFRSIAFAPNVMHGELIAGGSTVILGGSANIQSLQFSVSSVPEPATLVLMGAGLGLLGFAKRRR